jgi:hypothetical protein
LTAYSGGVSPRLFHLASGLKPDHNRLVFRVPKGLRFAVNRDERVELCLKGKEARNAWAGKMLAGRKAMESDSR